MCIKSSNLKQVPTQKSRSKLHSIKGLVRRERLLELVRDIANHDGGYRRGLGFFDGVRKRHNGRTVWSNLPSSNPPFVQLAVVAPVSGGGGAQFARKGVGFGALTRRVGDWGVKGSVKSGGGGGNVVTDRTRKIQ